MLTAPPHDPSMWSFDLGDELPDLAGLESDDGGDAEFIEMEEIWTEDGLNQWRVFLQKAQKAAQDAEREKENNLKRTPGFYPKNSAKTVRRCTLAADTLKQQGFLSVFDFMAAKHAACHTEPSPEPELEEERLGNEVRSWPASPKDRDLISNADYQSHYYFN